MNVESREASEPQGSVQQLFLQFVLGAQVIDEDRLEAAVQALNARRPESEQRALEPLLIAANETLDAVDMELVKARNDFAANKYFYFLINKSPLPPGMDRRFLSSTQAAQFKDILDVMFTDSRCEGISVPRDLPQDRFPSKSEIVNKLVSNRWLEELPAPPASAPRVFISMRCLYEMQPYLVERFGGKTLLRCLGCEQWFLAGRLCSNHECSARLHERCYEPYFRSRDESPGTCPKCASSF